MSTKEILNSIKQLPFNQRLSLIEKALKTLHESEDTQLEKAANSLLADYNNDSNLTAFTSIDFDKFYEAR
jgi:hypothetical protein